MVTCHLATAVRHTIENCKLFCPLNQAVIDLLITRGLQQRQQKTNDDNIIVKKVDTINCIHHLRNRYRPSAHFFYKYVGICTPFILHTNEMPFQRHQTCMRTQIQTQLHWLIPNSHRPLRAKKKSLLFLSLFMLVKYMWANITPTSTLPIVSSLKRNSRLLVYVMWMTNAGEKKKHARQKTFVLPVKKSVV